MGNGGFAPSPHPLIQHVTQIPLKCLVSPPSSFGGARLPLAWMKIKCPTLRQLWARKADGIWQRDSPALCTGPPHSPWSAQAERTAGHRLYQAALPTADRAACWFPSSLTASKAAPLFGYKWRRWRLFALLREAACVLLGRTGLLSSAERSRAVYMACWSHKYLGYSLWRLLTDILGYRHPWLHLILLPLPSLGPASP